MALEILVLQLFQLWLYAVCIHVSAYCFYIGSYIDIVIDFAKLFIKLEYRFPLTICMLVAIDSRFSIIHSVNLQQQMCNGINLTRYIIPNSAHVTPSSRRDSLYVY